MITTQEPPAPPGKKVMPSPPAPPPPPPKLRHVQRSGRRLCDTVPPDVSRCRRRHFIGCVRQIVVVRHGLTRGTGCTSGAAGTSGAGCARCPRSGWSSWSCITLRTFWSRRTCRTLHRIGTTANGFIC